MKLLLPVIFSIALGVSFSSTVSASSSQGYDTVIAKYGTQVVYSQSLLNKEVLEALVEPYLEEIVNQSSLHNKIDRLKVWIIADDGKGYKVFYDQNTRKFGLAKYTKGQTPFTSGSLNVQNELTKLFLAGN